MSLAFSPIRPVLVRDPRTMVNKERAYAILKMWVTYHMETIYNYIYFKQ